MKTTIVTYDGDTNKLEWQPTTISDIGKDEKCLESVLVESPELLHLENRRTRISGPFRPFRQLNFSTPQSRKIIPDIIFLTGSGDVVVVEVKLSTNPELKDRRVIAQAIDYSASLSALSDEELARLFSDGKKDEFLSVVQSNFPDEEDPEELSDVFLNNINTGNIHIIIACDKVPHGLYELAKSVSVQSSLSFSLNILEVTPFKSNLESSSQILFVPNLRLSTEIVARTAISVSYPSSSSEPTVNIETTSLEEIEENISAATRATKSGRLPPLTLEELNNMADDNHTLELFQLAVREFRGLFDKEDRTRSGITFSGIIDGRKKSIVSLFPGAGSEEDGLAVGIAEYALVKKFDIPNDHFSRVVGVQDEVVKSRVDRFVVSKFWNPVYGLNREKLDALLLLLK